MGNTIGHVHVSINKYIRDHINKHAWMTKHLYLVDGNAILSGLGHEYTKPDLHSHEVVTPAVCCTP